jgi:hypothetical protein
LIFYILVTWISEKVFGALTQRVQRGMPIVAQEAI